jgi:hypothetical protein
MGGTASVAVRLIFWLPKDKEKMRRYWKLSLPFEDERLSTHIAPKPGKQLDTLFQSV